MDTTCVGDGQLPNSRPSLELRALQMKKQWAANKNMGCEIKREWRNRIWTRKIKTVAKNYYSRNMAQSVSCEIQYLKNEKAQLNQH